MRRTKFASILAAAFIFGGSTVLGATSPIIQLKGNDNQSVTVAIQDLPRDIYGIQIELTTKESLDNKGIDFKAKDQSAYSFAVTKGNKITIYIASNKVLNTGNQAVLGDLIDITDEQFDKEAISKYKVVDYFFTPMDETDISIQQPTPENPVPENPTPENPTPENPAPEDPAPEDPTPENPTPENPVPENPTPEEPSVPVQPGDTEDDDSSSSQGGNVQKPVKPIKPVKPEESTEPEKPSVTVVEFADTKGHWAAESIGKMASRGVLKGYEDGTFGPSKQITRAEFAAVVARAFGFEETVTSLPFKDTALGKWYTQPVASLYQKGIITGRPDGTFGVNDSITNQEMAVMISRSLKALEADLEVQRSYEAFKDAATISPFAQEAVKELYELGIISGMPDGSYQPKASSTRAQVAVIVDRILTMMETK